MSHLRHGRRPLRRRDRIAEGGSFTYGGGRLRAGNLGASRSRLLCPGRRRVLASRWGSGRFSRRGFPGGRIGRCTATVLSFASGFRWRRSRKVRGRGRCGEGRLRRCSDAGSGLVCNRLGFFCFRLHVCTGLVGRAPSSNSVGRGERWPTPQRAKRPSFRAAFPSTRRPCGSLTIAEPGEDVNAGWPRRAVRPGQGILRWAERPQALDRTWDGTSPSTMLEGRIGV